MNEILRDYAAVAIGLVVGLVGGEAFAGDSVSVGAFSQAEFATWEEHIFKGHTHYDLSGDGLEKTLIAKCDTTASALYRKINIDLEKTPILHWSWRVDAVYPDLLDTTKSGDDYAARIYVVYAPSSVMPWRTKAIDYVWSNSQALHSAWPNAFTDQAMMIALRSGQPTRQAWVSESRNVRDDFRKYFNVDMTVINGVAIMTDCDNANRPMTGYYKDIYFSDK